MPPKSIASRERLFNPNKLRMLLKYPLAPDHIMLSVVSQPMDQNGRWYNLTKRHSFDIIASDRYHRVKRHFSGRRKRDLDNRSCAVLLLQHRDSCYVQRPRPHRHTPLTPAL